MNEPGPRLPRIAALTCSLTLPSVYLFEKFAVLWAIPVYVLAVGGAAWAWESEVGRRFVNRISERSARVSAAVSFLLLIALFVVVYRIANSGQLGRGSDSDEALNQGIRALLSGRFPYYERTYLNNRITPMPGELLLALPFVLIVGNAVYQWPVWLGAGALVLRAYWRQTSRAWLFSMFVCVACPAVLHQLMIGTDYLTNALMIVLPSIGLVTASARGAGTGETWALAIGLGLTMSSRSNFAFVLPLVLSRLWQTQRARGAALFAAIVASGAVVTLPFFLYDPQGFSPLYNVREKAKELNVVLPHADVFLPVAVGLLALLLARPRWNHDTKAFLRNAALVQAAAFTIPSALYAVSGLPSPTSYTYFGTLFLPFGLAAYVATTPRDRSEIPESGRTPALRAEAATGSSSPRSRIPA